ncbi:lachesin [Aplysia californica]|uniref:Lachesin n=1 Tax=Aplysia californica TaxID=6500 RepID=A0ABM0JE59_APLCA|nr:lachesin [Aplysia californica]XP_005091634.1 lachesin [Aplysia californica]XP_005091636.1 lachesin [Aplysia californica]XP_005091637.1 lachesin [Aplysia californica]XP_012946768.1 lachesin [Aplysia californica]
MDVYSYRSEVQLLITVSIFFCLSDGVFTSERVIDETPMTIRVVSGTTALLPCSVDPRYAEQYADEYKVLWTNPEGTAISMQDRRIINDVRMSVERPFLKDWNLHIRNVSLTDAGLYKCQINTDPVGTKKVKLVVQEPPKIVEHSIPIDVEKPEGENVDLFCNATGTPPPQISWYRLYKNKSGKRERVGLIGDSLVIHNISRVCADDYECVADNGVQPAMSQVFKVTVHYPPEVRLPNTRLGQHKGKDTILECEVSASPLGYAAWKHRGRTLINSHTHELTLYNSNPDEGIILSLRILRVEAEDFGKYVCEAKNTLGVTYKTMELYELQPKRPPTTTTTTTTSRHVWIHKRPPGVIEVDNPSGHVTSNNRHGDPGVVRDRNPHRQLVSHDDALRSEESDSGPSDGRYSDVRSNNNGDENTAARCLLQVPAYRLLLALLTTILFWNMATR